ncbi:MAG TPA: hypothetical protein PLA11_15825 [Flavobacteriales bacterium]|nr:hypothetical protein [Flavobacteriales bacterium]MCB0808959.1 hypothetical protein [Flavobacteriales bacterium]HOP44990.1 hypothetical protein [Flavobacteriales bacterium]
MKQVVHLRPQDVVILLKLVALGKEDWLAKDLARELHLSPAEVSNSLGRSAFAGLLDQSKRHVQRAALLDLLLHGLPYVYPVRPGGRVRGVPTAHSAAPLKDLITAGEAYVWPHAHGDTQGLAIAPLYPSATDAALEDPGLHELLALVDALRVGRTRERAEAGRLLTKRLKG